MQCFWTWSWGIASVGSAGKYLPQPLSRGKDTGMFCVSPTATCQKAILAASSKISLKLLQKVIARKLMSPTPSLFLSPSPLLQGEGNPLIYIGQHLKVINNVILYLQQALSSVVNSHHQIILPIPYLRSSWSGIFLSFPNRSGAFAPSASAGAGTRNNIVQFSA